MMRCGGGMSVAMVFLLERNERHKAPTVFEYPYTTLPHSREDLLSDPATVHAPALRMHLCGAWEKQEGSMGSQVRVR